MDVLEFLKHNDISSEAFVAKLAKKKSESFMHYKDANGIKEFLQKNEASIKKLNSLQYDRWGNDLSNK
jgi:hypothetical protein